MLNKNSLKIVPEIFFNGSLDAFGSFSDRFGNVRRKFIIKAVGVKTLAGFTLEENFEYDDGELDHRIWTVIKKSDSQYEGEANDVFGKVNGIINKNIFEWSYDFNLKLGSRKIWVKFSDEMFLKESNILLNTTKVSKFGILLGEVNIQFNRLVS